MREATDVAAVGARRRPAATWCIGVLLLTLVAATPPARAASTAYVHAKGFAFVPQDVTINVGDAVQWDNLDHTTHTLTDRTCKRAGGTQDDDECPFNHDLLPGTIFTHTFADPGVYAYKCVIHDLAGSVTVVGDGAQLPDLVVEAVRTASSSVNVLRITATIRNVSTVAGAARSQVVFSYRYGGELRRISAPLGNPLPKGASYDISALWNTTGKVGDFEILVEADGLTQIVESDETNNSRAASTSVAVPPGTVSPGIDVLEPPQ